MGRAAPSKSSASRPTRARAWGLPSVMRRGYRRRGARPLASVERVCARRARQQPRAMGRLLLRLLVGGFFFGHGTQKLFGWFGGGGLDGTAGFFESIGLRPGRRHALAAGVAEAGGGVLLAAGLAAPVAAASL